MNSLLNFLSERKKVLFPILLLILFVLVILAIIPFRQAFEYDADEGINLMKASLFLHGFHLYKEIWSDQPPLLTIILSFWFKLFGLSVYSGRLLILFFSVILLWAFYQTIKTFWGNFRAYIATVFLILSALYLKLSVSVMIGIPALCFTMLSIYCLTLYRKLYLKRLLVLSAIFMALSLQTKLFTAFLIPIIILEIIGVKKQQNRLFSVLLWLSILLVFYLSITTIFFNFNLPLFIQQLLKPHLLASVFVKPEYNFSALYGILYRDYDIILLALIGIFSLIKQKKWRYLFPASWLILAFAMLAKHRPLWQHHYLLISIPLCWLAAIGFSECLLAGMKKKKLIRWLTLSILILVLLRLPFKYNNILIDMKDKTSTQERKAVRLLSSYSRQVRWMFTDMPIFAFYADIQVPPELAVISAKRIFTKNLRSTYLITMLEKYEPEIILLGRFQNKETELKIMPYVHNYYREIARYGPQTLPSPSYLMPSFKGKSFFLKWLNNFLWHRKLAVMQTLNLRKHSNTEITIYIRKTVAPNLPFSAG